MENMKSRSNGWYILPIFLGWIGGLIAYFILRRDDPRKAKNCLYLGDSFRNCWINSQHHNHCADARVYANF